MPVFITLIQYKNRCWKALFLIAGMMAASPVHGQGVALRAVSATNESIGGVATATPIDAAGALAKNPATISALPSSEISFSMALILPSSDLASSLPANALGSGSPAMSGVNGSEAGAVPGPGMAFVQKNPGSPWTYGMGFAAIGGSAVNYSASTTNPILLRQPYGLGQLAANVDIFQITPTLSYQINERLSFGFGPTITMGKVYADPLFLSQKYGGMWPAGIGTRYVWGGGAQMGIYYKTDSHWNYGASVSSPQWIEPFRYKSISAAGQPISCSYDLDYPLVASIGTSYTGFDKWLIGCDLRYFDYADTPGFSDSGFDSTGALRGLGWNSIMSVALGLQREVTERLVLRCGYCFNENPIGTDVVQYNVASPLIIQHTAHIGGSYTFQGNWIGTVAYCHGFENSVTGPMHRSSGVIPDSSVTSTVSADVLSIGVTKRY
jgi:long-chain fatty acid transport protein